MPELLANGGNVTLWAGWSMTLPASHHQRNNDGSWSAWGADWAIDVQIIEVGGIPAGKTGFPEELLGPKREITLTGIGWIGSTERFPEMDAGREVFRLAGTLAAPKTVMLCWVSYLRSNQQPFAESLLGGVAHHEQAAA